MKKLDQTALQTISGGGGRDPKPPSHGGGHDGGHDGHGGGHGGKHSS